MPNDVKLGLLIGIALVVLIGMVFFRADPPTGGAAPPPTTSVNSSSGGILPPQNIAPNPNY